MLGTSAVVTLMINPPATIDRIVLQEDQSQVYVEAVHHDWVHTYRDRNQSAFSLHAY